MSSNILSRQSENSNQAPTFDSTLTVDARFTGGMITLSPEHVEWLEATLLRVEMPGTTLMLYTHEARDFARQLLNLAQFIDEEPREITRRTEPGAPGFEDLGAAS